MPSEFYTFSLDEAAAATALEVAVVRHYAELGLITPSSRGYSEVELAELRCVRRLREELELDHPAVEIILRMRRRIMVLQEEVRRLDREQRSGSGRTRLHGWVEAEWEE